MESGSAYALFLEGVGRGHISGSKRPDHLLLNTTTPDLIGLLQAYIIDPKEGDTYQWLTGCENMLYFAALRGELTLFEKWIGIIRQALPKRLAPKDDIKIWDAYISFFYAATQRVYRNLSLERFELLIEQIEWSTLAPDFTSKYSSLIGWVFTREDSLRKRKMGGYWLKKALETNSSNQKIIYTFLFAYSLFKTDADEELYQFAQQLDNKQLATQTLLKQLDIWIKLLHIRKKIETGENIPEQIRALRVLFAKAKKQIPNYPILRSTLLKGAAAFILRIPFEHVTDKEKRQLLKISGIFSCIAKEEASKNEDELLHFTANISWISTSTEAQQNINNQQINALIKFAHKQNNNLLVAQTYRSAVRLFQPNKKKAFSITREWIQTAIKQLPQNGIYNFVNGFASANQVLNSAFREPGISWAVEEILPFFNLFKEKLKEIEPFLHDIDKEDWDALIKEYNQFAKPAQNHIKVQLQYPLIALRLIQMGTIKSNCNGEELLVTAIIKALSQQESPMAFLSADWADFKDVPNQVRNKVINQCITITKGDLPKAAEHLQFSYRNLRSYISLNEVDRLGYFLKLSETPYKQLEKGIRLMLYDLYQKGTIFEVVFDLPKFLLDHLETGFTASDIETKLQVKGTTAKKYIRTMINIGLIIYQQTEKRRRYFKLNREKIMLRLIEPKPVLAS